MNSTQLTAFTILVAACSRPHSQSASVAVRLVDSVAWEVEFGMDASGVLHRVAVDYAGRTDTVPGILTSVAPVLVGDSVVFGFSYRENELLAGFSYDLRSKNVTTIGIPPDLSESPTLSPRGDQLAYWSTPGDETAALVIRRWPAGVQLYRSEAFGVPATDALLSQVEWMDAATVRWTLEVSGGRALVGSWSASSGLMIRDTVPITVAP